MVIVLPTQPGCCVTALVYVLDLGFLRLLVVNSVIPPYTGLNGERALEDL